MRLTTSADKSRCFAEQSYRSFTAIMNCSAHPDREDRLDISGPHLPPPLTPPAAPAKGRAGESDAALRQAAESLEANFLSVMLKSAGLGEVPGLGGGGQGEEQFASFLRDEQARLMVQAGGIGLSEHLFQALKKGQSHA
jgi:peptidoglycan hydrolase FlgJ